MSNMLKFKTITSRLAQKQHPFINYNNKPYRILDYLQMRSIIIYTILLLWWWNSDKSDQKAQINYINARTHARTHGWYDRFAVCDE